MASGCAIVSSVPLEFEGVHVSAGDVGSMVAAIRSMWENPERLAQMSQRNVELASRYSWDRFTSALLDTYQQILGRQLSHEECHA